MKLFQNQFKHETIFGVLNIGDTFQYDDGSNDKTIWMLAKADFPGQADSTVLIPIYTSGNVYTKVHTTLPSAGTSVYNVNKFYLIHEDDLPK